MQRVKDPSKIKLLMKYHNVTNRSLAATAGWPNHSMVSRLLNGTRPTVKDERAAAIAGRLGVPVDALFLSEAPSKSVDEDQEDEETP